MVKEGVVDGINGVEAMFAGSRDIGTYRTEDMGTVWCTEAVGDLLLDFNHAHDAFDEVVVEGDAEVMHEG